jgi:hypothetical protein
VPRHPPNALKSLDYSHYQCSPGVSVLGRTDGITLTVFGKTRYLESCLDCASICLSRGGETPRLARGKHTNKSLHSRCQSAYAPALSRGETVCQAGQAYPGVFIMDGVSRDGGDRRDRTDDLKLAKLPLSQLSYVPS